jgi:hypothetical protein
MQIQVWGYIVDDLCRHAPTDQKEPINTCAYNKSHDT